MTEILSRLAKKIVIITENYLFYNSIRDNLSLDITLITGNNLNEVLNSHNKIDLLISDFDYLEEEATQRYKIKAIINLTTINKSLKGEINISKPLRLNSLLKIIEDISNSSDIFCELKGGFVYHENLGTLTSSEKSITLTTKENDIFKFILLSQGNKVNKWLLLKKVWNYHKNSETSTVDTHLYKLKTKLPEGMLKLIGSSCQLDVI